jgi:alkyl hydroperoxide reductase subunit D
MTSAAVTPAASALDALRDALPEEAKDLKLNLGSVLTTGATLTKDQTWGIALTCAYFIGNDKLRAAIAQDAAAAGVSAAVVSDAKAAAAIMGMNTIYYRFRHMVKNPAYQSKSPRLRMQRMANPATSKADFELFSLAVAVLEGCEMCVGSHEASILKHGLTDEHVHETVRIAAACKGVAVALSFA